MDKVIERSFKRLSKYCSDEKYKGWDPYDGLTSSVFKALPLLPSKKITRLAWIQFIKRMPINLRPVLGIKKGYNPKGLALFVSGYSSLSKVPEYADEAKQKVEELTAKMLDLRTPGFSGNCWGYNFDWESRAFFQKQGSPTIVATTFVANSLLDAYDAFGKQEYLDEAISSVDFVVKDLNRTYDAKGNFAFSYSPYDKTSVFNASLLGARLLSRVYYHTKTPELKLLAEKAVRYCCQYQNQDGSWFYSTLPFHQWIDNFHTGFNLECIADYGRYTGDNSFSEQLKAGLKYYLDTFFDSEGRSAYYNQSVYPIDIHAPAQLIVTLSKLGILDQQKELADRVLGWTIKNMQSGQGYFYYQKRKYLTNTISYMRWSQAWIFYAFAKYFESEGNRSGK